MNTKTKNVVTILAVSVVIGALIYLTVQYKILKEKQEKMQEDMDKSKSPKVAPIVSSQLMSKISKLKSFFREKNRDIYRDLEVIIRDLNSNRESNASRMITICVENLLKDKAEREDSEWFNGFKKPDDIKLHFLLERGAKTGIFSEEELQFAMLNKKFRNSGSHKTNVEEKFDYNTKMINVHAGVYILEKLAA